MHALASQPLFHLPDTGLERCKLLGVLVNGLLSVGSYQVLANAN